MGAGGEPVISVPTASRSLWNASRPNEGRLIETQYIHHVIRRRHDEVAQTFRQLFIDSFFFCPIQKPRLSGMVTTTLKITPKGPPVLVTCPLIGI